MSQDADTPVEALIRHNITVHQTKEVRFLHGLLLVLMVGCGAYFFVTGIISTARGSSTGVLTLVIGAFLMFWGPYAFKKTNADKARKTAALQWQLDEMKAARLKGDQH